MKKKEYEEKIKELEKRIIELEKLTHRRTENKPVINKDGFPDYSRCYNITENGKADTDFTMADEEDSINLRTFRLITHDMPGDTKLFISDVALQVNKIVPEVFYEVDGIYWQSRNDMIKDFSNPVNGILLVD